MSDPRLTPSNARVTAAHLPAPSEGQNRVTGSPMQVSCPVVDLCRSPGGARDRQLLWGDRVTVYETREGWCFVQAEKDGYVGYIPAETVSPAHEATHLVSARATHVYSAPDMKSPDRLNLSFGSRIAVGAVSGGFAEIEEGFLPVQHLSPIGVALADPVEVAARFLGTPYLWGGNSHLGVDCSGLVQAAVLACGMDCPGDSDMQAESLGVLLPAGSEIQRGDLLFWKGHVGLVAGPDTLLHANAFHMATAYEPLEEAISRIKTQGDGPVTAHRRLSVTG
ncbi:C40 family peptidase [Primorskyibacter sp. S87]|uniref:C40 family peptidase n=1 Tax=Primorskyibacter sp. S87 TaxID=3415126 RepID=UPI003C7A47D6